MPQNKKDFYKFPIWLLETGLSPLDMLVYMLIADRLRYSSRNGWQENGRPFCLYTIPELCANTHYAESTVRRSLSVLREKGLLEYRRISTGACIHFLGSPAAITAELSTRSHMSGAQPAEERSSRSSVSGAAAPRWAVSKKEKSKKGKELPESGISSPENEPEDEGPGEYIWSEEDGYVWHRA